MPPAFSFARPLPKSFILVFIPDTHEAVVSHDPPMKTADAVFMPEWLCHFHFVCMRPDRGIILVLTVSAYVQAGKHEIIFRWPVKRTILPVHTVMSTATPPAGGWFPGYVRRQLPGSPCCDDICVSVPAHLQPLACIDGHIFTRLMVIWLLVYDFPRNSDQEKI